MLTGMEGGLNLRVGRLHGRYFRALGARVVSSAIWFVADVPKLTIGATAGMAPCWSGWVGVGWMGVLGRIWDWPVVVDVAE